MNDLVFIKKHQAVCDSLQVAEKFGKRHAEVLYAIEGRPCSCGGKGCRKCNYRGYQQRGLLDELQNADHVIVAKSQVLNSGENSSSKSIVAKSQVLKMYQKSSYKDSRGRSKTLYIMNRDGFTLLAMGFTGQEALIWKLRYIQAFNLMEQNLLQHQSPVWKDTRAYQKAIRRQETDTIKLFVEYAQSQGSAHSDQYYTQFSLLANKAVGITDRELATVQQLNILAMVENMIARRIEELITGNMPYKAIYQDCKDYIAGFQKYIGVDTGMTFSCQSME